jgi:predicted amidohydrolase
MAQLDPKLGEKERNLEICLARLEEASAAGAGGDELSVYDTPLGRIGIEICYDLRFPEATRTLALKGADLVAHPTNFPVAARIQTELITVARAAENRVFLLTANRVGKERWAEFCGRSQIVDPYGTRLAESDPVEETLLVADVEVEQARDKDYVIPGDYELYLFGDRRPELYGLLVEESLPITT